MYTITIILKSNPSVIPLSFVDEKDARGVLEKIGLRLFTPLYNIDSVGKSAQQPDFQVYSDDFGVEVNVDLSQVCAVHFVDISKQQVAARKAHNGVVIPPSMLN